MAKQLKDVEWRFWIVNREVVAYSPYSWQNEICWALAPNKVLKIAKLVAENPWQPDIAYVVDIVETPMVKCSSTKSTLHQHQVCIGRRSMICFSRSEKLLMRSLPVR
jgi:hypothetical protein